MRGLAIGTGKIPTPHTSPRRFFGTWAGLNECSRLITAVTLKGGGVHKLRTGAHPNGSIRPVPPGDCRINDVPQHLRDLLSFAYKWVIGDDVVSPGLPLRYCVQLCMAYIDQPSQISEPYDLAYSPIGRMALT
jgi:hypothetical protein